MPQTQLWMLWSWISGWGVWLWQWIFFLIFLAFCALPAIPCNLVLFSASFSPKDFGFGMVKASLLGPHTQMTGNSRPTHKQSPSSHAPHGLRVPNHPTSPKHKTPQENKSKEIHTQHTFTYTHTHTHTHPHPHFHLPPLFCEPRQEQNPPKFATLLGCPPRVLWEKAPREMRAMRGNALETVPFQPCLGCTESSIKGGGDL